MSAALTLPDAARMIRDALKDRSYRALPLGLVVARYLRWKRSEWGAQPSTMWDYEDTLAKLCLHFADLELADLEPPVGRERCREFVDHYWGGRQPRTRNKQRSILRDFFTWAVREAHMIGSPMVGVGNERERHPARETYSRSQVHRMVAGQAGLADRIAVRLLVQYGLRRGEVAAVQLKHFDFDRSKLTVHGKGGKARLVPVPDPALWRELGQLQLERRGSPDEFLLYPRRLGRRGTYPDYRLEVVWEDRLRGLNPRSLHDWWYRRLEEAGLVDQGVRHGWKMHAGRHTAGQALLDHTGGNLKAVQKMLGHSSIDTTADIYTDWDDAQLADSMAGMFEGEE